MDSDNAGFASVVLLGMGVADHIWRSRMHATHVYIFQPGSDMITPNHICVAGDLLEAKNKLLSQLPWLLRQMNDCYDLPYNKCPEYERQERLHIWLPNCKILELPLTELRVTWT